MNLLQFDVLWNYMGPLRYICMAALAAGFARCVYFSPIGL